MANIATHSEAIAKELDPQVWTTRQPWFAERIAALQSRIKKS
jgi:enoyl-CoA hydratase